MNSISFSTKAFAAFCSCAVVLICGSAAIAADPYDEFGSKVGPSVQKQDAQDRKRAYDKGKAAHQSIQSGGSASPKKDGYAGMMPHEKEAYKKGYRGE